MAVFPSLAGAVLVLGSGPNARPPSDYQNRILLTVNASQIIARRWGQKVPYITLLGSSVLNNDPANIEAKEMMKRGHTENLIVIKGNLEEEKARLRLRKLGYTYQSIQFLTKDDRAQILSDLLGIPITEKTKPSNGVFLALLAVHLGARQVLMTGFSLSQNGHAYNNKGRPRAHAPEDRIVLARAMEINLPIFTNDPNFAQESGLHLFNDE